VFKDAVGLLAVSAATVSLVALWALIRRKRRLALRLLVSFQVTMILLAISYAHFPNIIIMANGESLSLYEYEAPEKTLAALGWALLVGSVPRKAGMEREDLLGINGKIFIGQGQAIEKNAASDVRVLVVGNPCNTNCLIAMNNAKEIPSDRWFAMTRLDENRARAQLAHKAGVGIGLVTNMTIWGNHSSTQYPDFYNARIDDSPANEVIRDEKWLKEEFIATVQQRGAAVIKARGLSSAGSAANAVVDTVFSLTNDTPGNDWHSVAVCSDGSYDVEKGLISSFPISVRSGKWEIVQGLPINDFSRAKIDASLAELKEEKSLVAELLGK